MIPDGVTTFRALVNWLVTRPGSGGPAGMNHMEDRDLMLTYLQVFTREIVRAVFDPIIKDAATFTARWIKRHPTKAMRIQHAQRSRFHRKRPRL